MPSELVIDTPGSQPLRNPKHEQFARLRAMLRPKAEAFRQCGLRAATDKIAVDSAWRLEHRKDVAERIAFLSRQDEDLIKAKRQRLEESLWNILEADPGTMFDAAGVKDLKNMPAEVRQAIEAITVDKKGRLAAAKLYSKLQANAELRKMLGVDKPSPQQSEVDRMSDAELVSELARQARELGIEIDLSYKFSQEE